MVQTNLAVAYPQIKSGGRTGVGMAVGMAVGMMSTIEKGQRYSNVLV
jgi:hypothetical protein